jgi:hypothetical protein
MSGLIVLFLGLPGSPAEAPAELWMNVGHHWGHEVRQLHYYTERFSSESFGATFHQGIRTYLYYGLGVCAVVTAEVDQGRLSAGPGVTWRPIEGVELSFGVDLIRGRPVGAASYWVGDVPGRSTAFWQR